MITLSREKMFMKVLLKKRRKTLSNDISCRGFI